VSTVSLDQVTLITDSSIAPWKTRTTHHCYVCQVSFETVSMVSNVPARTTCEAYTDFEYQHPDFVFEDAHFCTSARNDICDMPKDLVAVTSEELRRRYLPASTCRQLYAETEVLPLTSTVFEFAHSFALTSCMKVLPPPVKEIIKEIGFYARYGGRSSPAAAKQMIDGRVEEVIEASARLPNLEPFISGARSTLAFMQMRLISRSSRRA
jgi:hypothetical protein